MEALLRSRVPTQGLSRPPLCASRSSRGKVPSRPKTCLVPFVPFPRPKPRWSPSSRRFPFSFQLAMLDGFLPPSRDQASIQRSIFRSLFFCFCKAEPTTVAENFQRIFLGAGCCSLVRMVRIPFRQGPATVQPHETGTLGAVLCRRPQPKTRGTTPALGDFQFSFRRPAVLMRFLERVVLVVPIVPITKKVCPSAERKKRLWAGSGRNAAWRDFLIPKNIKYNRFFR